MSETAIDPRERELVDYVEHKPGCPKRPREDGAKLLAILTYDRAAETIDYSRDLSCRCGLDRLLPPGVAGASSALCPECGRAETECQKQPCYFVPAVGGGASSAPSSELRALVEKWEAQQAQKSFHGQYAAYETLEQCVRDAKALLRLWSSSPAPSSDSRERLVLAVKGGLLRPWILMLCPDGAGGRRFESLADVPLVWGCSCGFTHAYSHHDTEVLFDMAAPASSDLVKDAPSSETPEAPEWEVVGPFVLGGYSETVATAGLPAAIERAIAASPLGEAGIKRLSTGSTVSRSHPCPCGLGLQPWHYPRWGVCRVGAEMPPAKAEGR